MSQTIDSNAGRSTVTPLAGKSAADFGASLTNAVRDNPASAALIGMGVAWLFFGGSKTSLFGSRKPKADHHRSERDDYQMRFEPVRQGYGDRLGNVAGGVGSAAQNAAGAVGSANQQIGAGVAGGVGQIASVASDGYAAASSYAGDAAAYVGSAAYDASRAGSRIVRSQAGHVQQTVGEFFEDQPIALGVLGLALGAGIAALLPSTEIESAYFGETSDAIKQQARALAGDKLDSVKALAATTLDEVSKEAEAQGLTTSGLSDMAGDLKDRLSNVASAAKSSVQDETGRSS